MSERMNRPQNGTPSEGPPRVRRVVRVLLFVSLALNLLVAGLVLGAVFKFRGGDRPPPHLEQAGGPMTRALSHADRREIGRALRKSYREMRPARDEIRAEYEALAKLLKAEPFDPDAVRASMDRQMQAMGQRQRLGQDLLIKRLQQMDAAERASYADRLLEVLHTRHKRGGVRN